MSFFIKVEAFAFFPNVFYQLRCALLASKTAKQRYESNLFSKQKHIRCDATTSCFTHKYNNS